MATAAEVCTTCSSAVITKAMGLQPAHKDVLQSYYTKVQTEWANYPSLPGINEEVEWTVYKLSPAIPFKHYSLLFVCEDKAYSGSPGFTFELVYGPRRQSGNYVVPQTIFVENIRRGSRSTSKLGVIRDSAVEIMTKGLQCLVNFGDYHKVTRNCQHFCSKFAKELGVKQPWTDTEKLGAIAAATAGVFGAIVFGIAAVFTTLGSKKSDDYHDHSQDDYYDED